uniref:Uncharacterized protein n=1 Tax=Arundo donax TaxID=35708 RepID=A0A0A9BPQ1_ARUDO
MRKKMYLHFFFVSILRIFHCLSIISSILEYEFLMHANCLHISPTNIYDFYVYLASLHFLFILVFFILVVSFHMSSVFI